MDKILGSLFSILGLLLLLSFLIQFSGLLNLLLSIAIFFGAFMALYFLEHRKEKKDPKHAKVVFLSLSFFGLIWATSPVFLLTSDFCAYQSESSTQYFARASTPKEWFSSGNRTQIDSRVLTKSQTSQCEGNVFEFMITKQPFLIWIRLLVIGVSLWGFASTVSILWESDPSSAKARAVSRQKATSATAKEKITADELANKISALLASKKYRKSRSEIRKVEGWLKDLAGKTTTPVVYSQIVKSIEELIEDLPNSYSETEIADGMLSRKQKRLNSLLQEVKPDS